MPPGPNVHENDGKAAPAATYEDLLKTAYDDALFEHYFTSQQGNPDLKYFFADASLKFRIKKWKTDVEVDANNFLNVKTYNALYLTANALTASSYTLPGRIMMIKLMFNL